MPASLKKFTVVSITVTFFFASMFNRCVTVPREVKTSDSDNECILETKKYELAIYGNSKPYLQAIGEQNEKLPHCPATSGSSNDPIAIICGMIVLGIVTVSGTTFLVSGSIVVVNNTIRWIEKQGTCEDSDVNDLMREYDETVKILGGKFISTDEEIESWVDENSKTLEPTED